VVALVGSQTRIDADPGQTGLQQGEVELDGLAAVADQAGHVGRSLADETAQDVRQPIGPVGQLGHRPAPVTVPEGRAEAVHLLGGGHASSQDVHGDSIFAYRSVVNERRRGDGADHSEGNPLPVAGGGRQKTGRIPDYRFTTCEELDEAAIVRIMLNRPSKRNAQSRGLLVELNDAFLAAEADDRVRVVILGGTGQIFSSGHDIGSKEAAAEYAAGSDQHPTREMNGATLEGAEVQMLQASGTTSSTTRVAGATSGRSPPPGHGTVFAAALMLMWACDLIVPTRTPRSPP